MYFDKSGRDDTEQVASCVAEYVKKSGIKNIVVASVTGYTADIILNAVPDARITVVTHTVGMLENGVDEMGAERRAELIQRGANLVTATHVLSGVERSLSSTTGGIYPAEIIANSLKMFGAGVKVAVECATMALDNGAIPYGEDVISIGGTVRGADTAILIRPAHGARLFQTKIEEIICKPREFTPQLTIKDIHK